jgi:hypothetical protein
VRSLATAMMSGASVHSPLSPVTSEPPDDFTEIRRSPLRCLWLMRMYSVPPDAGDLTYSFHLLSSVSSAGVRLTVLAMRRAGDCVRRPNNDGIEWSKWRRDWDAIVVNHLGMGWVWSAVVAGRRGVVSVFIAHQCEGEARRSMARNFRGNIVRNRPLTKNHEKCDTGFDWSDRGRTLSNAIRQAVNRKCTARAMTSALWRSEC